jgi:hypothetical protein
LNQALGDAQGFGGRVKHGDGNPANTRSVLHKKISPSAITEVR